jgi:thiol-disulfide isomerase/thioredoxin
MIVYFYRPGCPHCEKFKPVWTKFKSKYGGVLDIREVNGSKSPALGEKMGIMGFPTVLALNGKERVEYEPEKRTLKTLETFTKKCYNPHLKNDLNNYVTM